MNVKQAYNNWAEQYDWNENKTRDLEAKALKNTLPEVSFKSCLEIGCGTGKNTALLHRNDVSVTAVDLSEEMLAKAKAKINSERVRFVQADILMDWSFCEGELYDLVTFSLVLEHIENLETVFAKVAQVLKPGGRIYIGELHPFKQYDGSKARFTADTGEQVVTCFNHHVSDFVQAGKKHGLKLIDLNEYFDEDDRTGIPRILTLLLEKN